MTKSRSTILWYVIAGTALMLAGLFLSGCGERQNPTDPGAPEYSRPATWSVWPMDFDNLIGNSLRDKQSRKISIYFPPGYSQPGQGKSFPVLYLLHDFSRDHDQFESYNLSTLVTDLINRGEIKPMIIVTVNASNTFGLGMYANSSVAGNYEDMIVFELIDNMVERNFNVIPEGRAARAIGGIGFGGQAAIKFAIKYPERFSSVSAINAPLSYAGDQNNNGIQDLFKYFFIENNLQPGEYDAYAAIRPSATTPITRMLFAMAAAYSPHEDTEHLRPWSVRFAIPGYTDVVYFDLPFDHKLYLEQPVWEQWLAHDAMTLLGQNPAALDSIPTYLDAAQQDEFGFHLQTEAFYQKLVELGTADVEYHPYSGTDDLPATHERMVGMRLTEILKFHSDHLVHTLVIE